MIWTIAGVIVFGYALACVALYLMQRDFLYYPTERVEHDFKVEILENEGERIEVIVLNEGKERGVIYFGGNGEAVAYNSYDYEQAFPDTCLYLMNYRGYGGSSGKPSEKGLFSDALSLYDRIAERHASISAIGRSLGSGVAVFLASQRPVEKLVLVTPFDSIRSIGQSQYPLFPVGLLLKDHYDSAKRIDEIEAMTLIILAGRDQIIPLKFSRRLIDRFPSGQARVSTIANAGHNDLSDSREYYELMRTFL